MKNSFMKMAMKNSTSDVLETMFFLPVDFSDTVDVHELWNTEKDQILAAKINFRGPFSGYSVIYIPRKLAVSITVDFFGIDEKNISEDQVGETVKEIINMIIGNTFSLYDQEAVFNLGVPELVGFSGFHKGSIELEDSISVIFETLDDHLVFLVNVKIDD